MMCYRSFLLSLNDLPVLVVDSDPDSRHLLTVMFEGYGAEVITTTLVGEALEILKHVKPDLLVSEIRLPKEDGYSLMRQVKALEIAQQVQIPAIALTVYAHDRDRALSSGYSQYLSNPFDIDELLEIIASLALTKHLQSVPA